MILKKGQWITPKALLVIILAVVLGLIFAMFVIGKWGEISQKFFP